MNQEEQIYLPISIVIPTLNEEENLKKLLESVRKQFLQPSEIVVADSPRTTDKTREVAKKYGAQVIDGGKVAEGRNLGARVATQEVILFLDADTCFPDNYYLAEMYLAFKKDELDIMSSLIRPDTKNSKLPNKVMPELVFNGYNGLRRLYAVTKRLFAEYGGALMVKKQVFTAVGGFTETNGTYGEDYLFSKAAIEKGYKYKVFTKKLVVSPRRYENPSKAAKALLGVLAMGVTVGFGWYKRKELAELTKKLYGELGGTTDAKNTKSKR